MAQLADLPCGGVVAGAASTPSATGDHRVALAVIGIPAGPPVAWTDGPSIPDKPTLDGIEAGWSDRWEADGDVPLRPLGATAGRVLDRHPAADGVGLDPHGARCSATPRPTPSPATSGCAGKAVFFPIGWDDNGLATERRVQNFYGVRCDPTPAVRPRLPAAVPRRHAEGPPRDPDLAAQLRRAVPRADRHRRGGLRGPLPPPRPVVRLVAACTRRSTTSAARRQPARVPAQPRPRRGLQRRGADACGTSTTARPSPRPRSRTASVPAPTTCSRSTGPTATCMIDTTRPELRRQLRRPRRPSRRRPLRAAVRLDGAHADLRRRGPRRRPPAGPAGQGHRHRHGLHVRRHHRRHVVARARPADAQRHRSRRPHRRHRPDVADHRRRAGGVRASWPG